MLAVTERQSLETLGREEKTASRTLGQLKTQIEEMETKKNKLTEDSSTQGEKKAEVMLPVTTTANHLMDFISLNKSWQLCKLTWLVSSKSMITTKANELA